MFAQHIETKGKALFDQVCHWDMEGIVAKKKDTTYSAMAGWRKVLPAYAQRDGRHEMFRERR
jgi:ATP-dependent DNA ligase